MPLHQHTLLADRQQLRSAGRERYSGDRMGMPMQRCRWQSLLRLCETALRTAAALLRLERGVNLPESGVQTVP
jgi:hypothetical protein